MLSSENTSVFISYAEADSQKAEKLYQDLKKAGISAWFDKVSLLPGQKVNLVEKQAIKEHLFFVVLLSKNSVKPGRVIKQINWALDVSDEMPESQVHIIPLKLEDCALPHERLKDLVPLDMEMDWQSGMEKIMTVIRAAGGNADVSEDSPKSDAAGRGNSFSSVPKSAELPGPVRNRWALLVGVNRYIDPAFSTLKFCVNDVLALEKSLKDLGYTVICLHDDAKEERLKPTRDNAEAELIRICEIAEKDDLLMVHFACHGKITDGNAVLITREIRQPTLAKKALPVAEVERIMRGSKARRLFLSLDACHTGLDMGRDVSDPEFIKNVHDSAEGFALIAASTSQQIAQECKDKEHGIFSWFLLDGLSGRADRAGKRFVTVDDLKNHVLDGLKKWNAQHGGAIQEPTARSEGLGDMILADFREKESSAKKGRVPRDMPNPFGDMGRIEDPDRFFDREEIMRRIFEELKKGSNISLTGETQIGKSSVLSMICKQGPEKMNLPPENFVYLSMEWVDDEEDFYKVLCEDLKIPDCRGGKLMRALRGKKYIVCLDEIEKMTWKGFSVNVRSHLRGLADGSAAPLRLLIASRSPLDSLFPDSPKMTSPLAGICMKMNLESFSEKVAREFIAHRLKPSGISFSNTEMETLLRESGGHPAKLQRAAADLFETYRN